MGFTPCNGVNESHLLIRHDYHSGLINTFRLVDEMPKKKNIQKPTYRNNTVPDIVNHTDRIKRYSHKYEFTIRFSQSSILFPRSIWAYFFFFFKLLVISFIFRIRLYNLRFLTYYSIYIFFFFTENTIACVFLDSPVPIADTDLSVNRTIPICVKMAEFAGTCFTHNILTFTLCVQSRFTVAVLTTGL